MFKENMIDTSLIAELIYETAYSENAALHDLANEGIFHMPELAFAYECGKAIIREKVAVFGDVHAKWLREVNLGNGGPTDLVFELENGEKLAIEFKLRNTTKSYENDIIKLCNLKDENINKLFCALIDVFDTKLPDGDDARLHHIENLSDYKVEPILKRDFKAIQNCYTAPTSCVVCVWLVS